MLRKILAAILLLLVLSACSSRPEPASTTPSATPDAVSSSAKSIETPSPTPAQTAAPSQAESSESPAESNPEEESQVKQTLVVYFSATGTTASLAEYVADILDVDLYEIIPEQPYTDADLAYYTGGRADQEQDDPSVRPAISGSVDGMENYGTIILGYPIWHGQAPRIISTFLESYDFTGKTILPFCTSHSSGIGSSDTDLHGLAEDADWLPGRRFPAGTSREDMELWLRESLQN